MHTRLNAQIRKVLTAFMLGGIVLLQCSGVSGSPVPGAELVTTRQPNKYLTVNTLRLSDGTSIEEAIINGPPVLPPALRLNGRLFRCRSRTALRALILLPTSLRSIGSLAVLRFPAR